MTSLTGYVEDLSEHSCRVNVILKEKSGVIQPKALVFEGTSLEEQEQENLNTALTQ